MVKKEKEVVFYGLSISEGIAIGTLWHWEELQEDVCPHFPISLGEVDHEIARYRGALSSSREDLRLIYAHLEENGSKEALNIIDAHIQMLQDPVMTTEIEDKIRESLQNTEAVFQVVIQEYEKKLSRSKDKFFQEKMNDVKDLSARILKHLNGSSLRGSFYVPPSSIVFSKEVTPSEMAVVDPVYCTGFISENNSSTSHTALMARAKGVPFVVLKDASLLLKNYQKHFLILDGYKGVVIVNPSGKTLKQYQNVQKVKKNEFLAIQKELCHDSSSDLVVKIYANVGELEEVSLLKESGSVGIGLFRTEYLVSNLSDLYLNQELQEKVYASILQQLNHKRTVFRLFDFGGDKYQEILEKEGLCSESFRGIRFLLNRPHILQKQLRALLKVSELYPIDILIPFVSDLEELREVKKIIKEILENEQNRLDSSNLQFRLGVMIEIPAAFVLIDFFVQECDFISIGSNDLTHYTLATNRFRPDLSNLISPAIFHMMDKIVKSCALYRKEMCFCGHLATDKKMIPLLIGLGIREFSCPAASIPLIRKTILDLDVSKAHKAAQKALTIKSSKELEAFLKTSGSLKRTKGQKGEMKDTQVAL
ncbi:MAG: phosphoenolpyruvate--protein phosphotransferase [Rhabdochlamydiaceae bacterium]